MTYRVVVLPGAKRQMWKQANWWTKHRSAEQAARWLTGVEHSIATLADDPSRHALARENDSFPFEVRQLLYGNGRHPTHRVIFSIDGRDILVHTVRHLAQDEITADDI